MYHNDSEIQKRACAAICSYALKDITYKQHLVNEGAHKLILTAVLLKSELTQGNNAEVIIWGCRALIALVKDSISMRCILRSTDIEAAIEAAKTTHRDNKELVIVADDFLSNIKPQTPTGYTGTHYYALQYVFICSCMYCSINLCPM
jgi:hypothetical protein